MDAPADSKRVVDHNKLPFDILSDQGAKLVTQLGLLHHEPMGRGDIAIPANFLMDKSGRIVWRHIATYVQDRADPDDIKAEVARLPA